MKMSETNAYHAFFSFEYAKKHKRFYYMSKINGQTVCVTEVISIKSPEDFKNISSDSIYVGVVDYKYFDEAPPNAIPTIDGKPVEGWKI